MKKVKKLTYYLILFSVVLGACGQKDEEDAERLSHVQEQVESLYNEEMNDLAEDVSVEKFEEVEVSIEAEKEEELNEENVETLEQTEDLYLNALTLYDLALDIQNLFVDEVVADGVEFEALDSLATRLAEVDQEKWWTYVERQEGKLVEAEKQLESIQTAEELVDGLYLDGDRVNREVSREEEDTAKEAVAQVQNEKIQSDLESRLEKVDQTLTKVEEEHRKATDGLGYFEGMYLSYDNFLLYLDEDEFYIAQNAPSDNISYYEVTEVINNTGQELTLRLYEAPSEMHDTEGGYYERKFYLSKDHQTIQPDDGVDYERLTQEEINEVYENLPGLRKRD